MNCSGLWDPRTPEERSAQEAKQKAEWDAYQALRAKVAGPKRYVLTQYHSDDADEVMGIFTSKAKAEKALKEFESTLAWASFSIQEVGK